MIMKLTFLSLMIAGFFIKSRSFNKTDKIKDNESI